MPAIISGQRLSDADLERIGCDNPGWRFERADDGALIVSPTATSGGSKRAEALVRLHVYATRVGGKVYGSSTGFIRADRLAAFAEVLGFWAMMSDVVIEVASRTDSWPRLTAKIDKYERDGAGYALSVDPVTRATYARGRCPVHLEFDIDAILDA